MNDYETNNRALSAKALLAAFDLKPKKAKGQNFLADPATARACVERADLSPDDSVLEIGPGLGALTIPMSRKAKQVIAVEWDSNLAKVLENQIESLGLSNITILNQDILKTDIRRIAGQAGGNMVVAANLPYNISSQVLIRLIQNRDLFKKAALMFQTELARRIMAEPGGKDYGRITVLAQYSSRIRVLYSLGPAHFYPKPQVDSQVLEFFFKEPDPAVNEDILFAVVKAAFAKRRKTLKNALSNSELPFSGDQAQAALDEAGIAPQRRAETLSVDEFVALAKAAGKQIQ
ncbi:16S rRNA (adenine1518-N6/adenine1519-N6)-dimethyltransferase [Desulfatibacillum alkenivorans DSM 16219]|jgi:16S rRNA (adenine1518-N6/adenine1519-N6)-dimethyltransferase|uniref:Ribosomal RNA small subunit methyltransferase A n=1 Tax=Desulfatibacillum alkenivorans DSM 16219 TaxID=1121393 RepID=A0A1M6E1Z5_9BACT|nr:16S rRNA (adenine(1518)-N(6)/adenine(1519)-N(6))-dimethyltransferase RsmA [Desulfatibacillum alkenivorans]SHI79516.1 16S rRNA (adenine1518-N6/adenine1519-N6)-dimethyltransferase [Desulfatibacillum alkenivorans DSM 16219]